MVFLMVGSWLLYLLFSVLWILLFASLSFGSLIVWLLWPFLVVVLAFTLFTVCALFFWFVWGFIRFGVVWFVCFLFLCLFALLLRCFCCCLFLCRFAVLWLRCLFCCLVIVVWLFVICVW